MTDGGHPVFASDDLVEVCGDDLDLQRDVIGDFLSHLDSQVDAVASAFENGDAVGVQRAAHSLKGSSVSVGGRAMVGVCVQLESLARAGMLEGARALVDQVRDEAGRLREALGAHLRGRAA